MELQFRYIIHAMLQMCILQGAGSSASSLVLTFFPLTGNFLSRASIFLVTQRRELQAADTQADQVSTAIILKSNDSPTMPF